MQFCAIHPWAQGQGFCKATNIHAQLEKRLCYRDEEKDWFYKDDNEPMRLTPPFRHPNADSFYGHRYGGQALAPKAEPIIVFQKPYEGKPVDSITKHGAGAINIDAARIKTASPPQSCKGFDFDNELERGTNTSPKYGGGKGLPDKVDYEPSQSGRWPANFALVHNAPHDCPACNGDGCEGCGGMGLVGGCRRVGTRRVKGSLDGVRTGGIWQTGGKEIVRAGHADSSCPSGACVARPSVGCLQAGSTSQSSR